MKHLIPTALSFFLCVCTITTKTFAQAAINTDGSAPHASTMLHVKSANKGLLIPNVALASLTDVVTIASPALSLLVYNTNATLPLGTGYYYWSGSGWNKLIVATDIASASWSLSGNTGTTTSHFLGTTDKKNLRFRVNNQVIGGLDTLGGNIFWGIGALAGAGANARRNIVLGNGALNEAVVASDMIAIGDSACGNTVFGGTAIAIGPGALKNSTTAGGIAIGYAALENCTSQENIAIGAFSGDRSTTGNLNIILGNYALYFNRTGNRNVAIGHNAVGSNNNISVSSNLAIGIDALSNTNTSEQIAIGDSALAKTLSGLKNTAIGFKAAKTNLDGIENTVLGYQALAFNSTGDGNTALGNLALHNTSLASYNTAIGDSALFTFNGVAAGRNTAVGYRSAVFTTGLRNTALGSHTLETNTSGSRNTAIGFSAGVSTSALDNTTALGAGVSVSSSNTMAFGDDAVTKWVFGLSTTSTASKALEVGNSASNGNGAYLTNGGTWTNTSDKNLKEDFLQVNGQEILNKVSSLSIQQWRYKGTSEYHIGPVAQDFKAAFNLGIDDKSISTIDPAGVALAAIQQLIKENQELKKRIEILERK